MTANGHTEIRDVLALDPDGRPCAFQLKGAGGSSISLSQWTKGGLQAQVINLVSTAITHPSIKSAEHHRSIFVTNGMLVEEVSESIEKMNKAWHKQSLPYELEVMVVGQLRDWALALDTDLWPTEPDDVRTLLEMFLEEGTGLLPKAKL